MPKITNKGINPLAISAVIVSYRLKVQVRSTEIVVVKTISVNVRSLIRYYNGKALNEVKATIRKIGLILETASFEQYTFSITISPFIVCYVILLFQSEIQSFDLECFISSLYTICKNTTQLLTWYR